MGTLIQYRYNPDHTVVFHSDSDRTGFKKPTSACKATGKRGRGGGGGRAPTQNNPVPKLFRKFGTGNTGIVRVPVHFKAAILGWKRSWNRSQNKGEKVEPEPN